MAQDVVKIASGAPVLPKLFAPDASATRCFIEFFTANIRNANTRRAYARAAVQFAVWCEREDIRELADIEPLHVAAYFETLQRRLAPPSVKQHLAAIRMLFDWLVVGQVIAVNPASPVRGPKYSVKKGKTAVLSAEEARKLLDSVNPSSHVGLRDRALIALMVYTFARIGAALKMRIVVAASCPLQADGFLFLMPRQGSVSCTYHCLWTCLTLANNAPESRSQVRQHGQMASAHCYASSLMLLHPQPTDGFAGRVQAMPLRSVTVLRGAVSAKSSRFRQSLELQFSCCPD
jgi:Phage integrase, N-terminal SAM-like domain